jgi:ComF family protein
MALTTVTTQRLQQLPRSQQPQRCGDCLRQTPAFDATIVATDYIAPVDQLVQALKFGNRLALAPLFGRMLLAAIRRTPEFARPALLTAVPLSAARLQGRGFNQALEIARPLAPALAIPLAPSLVVRSRDTKMQALLHPDERHENIRKAFMLPANMRRQLNNRHVAVVDDVMTTGETLNEIAATLKRGGASHVTNLVFARTPPR